MNKILHMRFCITVLTLKRAKNHLITNTFKYERTFILSRHNTTQFSRCFIELWNSLPNNIVLADKLRTSKTLAKNFLSNKCYNLADGFTIMGISGNHRYAFYYQCY